MITYPNGHKAKAAVIAPSPCRKPKKVLILSDSSFNRVDSVTMPTSKKYTIRLCFGLMSISESPESQQAIRHIDVTAPSIRLDMRHTHYTAHGACLQKSRMLKKLGLHKREGKILYRYEADRNIVGHIAKIYLY